MTYHRNVFPNLPVWIPMSFHPKKGWYTHSFPYYPPRRVHTLQQEYDQYLIEYKTQKGLDPPTKRVWWYTFLGSTAAAAVAVYFYCRRP